MRRSTEAPLRGFEIARANPHKLKLELQPRAVHSVLVGIHAEWLSPTKRQRSGALQDASRISEIIVPRVASWTAVALRRFFPSVTFITWSRTPLRREPVISLAPDFSRVWTVKQSARLYLTGFPAVEKPLKRLNILYSHGSPG